MGEYEYSSLQLSSSEIRIFEISPAIDNDDVHGKLIIAPLENVTNNYVALSYCWGSSAKTHAIYCDGRRLMVTSSLHSALHRLRKLGYFVIWADAICINQLNAVEKGAQVQMMGQIYKHAEQVICDLGEADSESQSAVDLLHLIISSLSGLTRLEPLSIDEFENHSLPAVHHEEWIVLCKLLRLPWFRRQWVIQELALAKSAHMLWGLTCFDWDVLDQAIDCIYRSRISVALRSNDIMERDDESKVNRIYNMGVLRDDVRKSGLVKLGDLVYLAQMAEVTDPRDKIYSVLGLTVDASDPALYVSYSEFTSTVYNRVSRRLIEKYGMDEQWGIKLLYYSSGPRDGVPSWVINWSNHVASAHASFGGQSLYDATRGTLRKLHLKDDSWVVVVAGSRFDSITRLGSARTRIPAGISWDGFCKWNAEARALIDDLPTYPTT